MQSIKCKITTLSNLFIGGAPLPFEIGGIDQQTVTDNEGYPYIPGSSLKGALRAIVHEDDSTESQEIANLYELYLQEQKEESERKFNIFLNEAEGGRSTDRIKEAAESCEKKYVESIKDVSEKGAEYLFGIGGLNNTPKILIEDFYLYKNCRDLKKCFSDDMKNSIEEGSKPVANPRMYRTARRGLVFCGEIQLYKIELLGDNAEELCKEYIKETLNKFNDGIYRLGNSKSRGYGKVRVEFVDGEESNEML